MIVPGDDNHDAEHVEVLDQSRKSQVVGSFRV
jgi:hypothetical protein